jgi:hypothetical protein
MIYPFEYIYVCKLPHTWPVFVASSGLGLFSVAFHVGPHLVLSACLCHVRVQGFAPRQVSPLYKLPGAPNLCSSESAFCTQCEQEILKVFILLMNIHE